MSKQVLTIAERKRGAILGAAVADAASLGFHWLYDQSRIIDLEPTSPEFRSPDKTDYHDFAGYFAHANKSAGDLSQYGEQHATMLRALEQNQGVYDKAKYETAFVECFGYGGSFSGYIDHPTRDTLNNIIIAENQAIERAMDLPFKGSDGIKRKLITKVLGSAKQFSGQALREEVEKAVRVTDNDDGLVEHAMKMLDQWMKAQSFHGADDTQLPALAKLPALVALYAQQDQLHAVVDSAVRVTNNNEDAVAFGQASANIIEAAITTGDPARAVDAATHEQTGVAAPYLQQVQSSLDRSTPDVTAEWGMACQLSIGFPSAMHCIARSGSFKEAVRQNIYAGGDSCGRSILIGAVMGACFGVGSEKGVPEQWIDKITDSESIQQSVDRVLNV